MQAIPNVVRIVMIMILFYLIFGIIAINQFKGRFVSCMVDKLSETMPGFDTNLPINNKWDCYNSGGDWYKKYYTFDNIYQAVASLFVISNIAGWQDFMYTGA